MTCDYYSASVISTVACGIVDVVVFTLTGSTTAALISASTSTISSVVDLELNSFFVCSADCFNSSANLILFS